MNAEKLSITLPSDMAAMIRGQVESGAFASDSDVIREALRLWQDHREERRHALASIRARIDEAAVDPEDIPEHEMREHFERRFADLAAKPGQ